jgi:anti-anti-sigma factor
LNEGVIGKVARVRSRPALSGRRLLPRAARKPAPVEPPFSLDVLPVAHGARPEPRFRIERSAVEGAEVIAPIGELDSSALAIFEEAVASSVGHTRMIVLDLSRLCFIDSCGLWAITTTWTSCRQRGVELSLSPGPEEVQRVFEVTGLADVLPFEDSSPRRHGGSCSGPS